jgi:hypothetical protein
MPVPRPIALAAAAAAADVARACRPLRAARRRKRRMMPFGQWRRRFLPPSRRYDRTGERIIQI